MMGSSSRRAKTAPSQYPRLPFHLLRLVQLLSSLVVLSIMAYFISSLANEDLSTPWTFVWLSAASVLSICALAFTVLMHCCVGLNPRLNLLINGALAVLWAMSWGILTWYMSGTLAGVCNLDNWEHDVGVMVCRIYKALFTFALLGLLSTLAGLALDIYVRRQQTRSGIYRLHDVDAKHQRAVNRNIFNLASTSQGQEQGQAQAGYMQVEGQTPYDTTYNGGQHVR